MFNIPIENRTIFITGASSGLGAHFAYLFAEHGASVILAARRLDRLNNIVADIEAKGGRAFAVEMDVSDPGSTQAAFQAAVDHFGSIDSVIANAGMSSEGMVLDLGENDLDAILDVNVKGVYLTIQQAAKHMISSGSKEKEHGRIVIVSSITANSVTPGIAAYSATKAAVQQLGKVAAREWAKQGISINMINPGYIETELNEAWFASEGGKRQIAKWPRKRLMDKSDLDPVIMHLISDQANKITGSVFTVDDGQSLMP